MPQLASVGFAFHKFRLTLDHTSPHEYLSLSVSHNVKFTNLDAMTPLEAIMNVYFEELYELAFSNGKFKVGGEPVANGSKSGGLSSDLGFNPFWIKITAHCRLVELQNGPAAMFVIIAFVAHDAYMDLFLFTFLPPCP